jgi:molybdenum cofactor cytidylyltransferase
MVSVILLAAGESRRMGRNNKLLLKYKGLYLIEHVIQQLSAFNLREIILVTGHQSDKIEMALSRHNLKIVHNENYKEGMTTSIQKGVESTLEDTNGFLIALSDQPLLPKEVIRKLLNAFLEVSSVTDKSIIVPTVNGLYYNPVIFSAHYKNEILNCKEMNGCKPVIIKNIDCVVEVEFESNNLFKDIDNPEEYELLRRQT